MKSSLRARLDGLALRLEELNRLLAAEDATHDLDQFKRLSREHSELDGLVTLYTRYRRAEGDAAAAADMAADPSMRPFAEEEMQTARAAMAVAEDEIQQALLPTDPNDERNTFLEIRAGTGGDESALFAGDLFRMYARYAERQGWTVEIISESAAERGGYKEVVAQVVGRGAYSKLKFESGGHRVQRVPETESQGRIHTSACTVAVLPEADPLTEVVLNAAELRIDTYRASGAGGQHVNKTESAIRVTHLPTGIVVECQDSRSQHKNREKALGVLAARIRDKQLREQQAKTASARKSLIGSGDRSERIRTYNFPQGRLTDHRINFTLYKLDRVMEGELDEIIGALAAEFQAEQLAQLAEEGEPARAGLTTAPMNVGDALGAAGLDRREARRLLAAATDIPEGRLVAHPALELDERSWSRFDAWAARRRQGEPIAYLIGWREFYGLTLAVTPAVLIPRHESELLVERALERLAVATPGSCRVLDLGTGSGALALAIKHERPSARVFAVDASRSALEVARGNAHRLGLDIDWREGHWFSAVPAERFDVIVSNPPYVASGDPHLGQGDLRFEPPAALVGGVDGLAAIRDIVHDAPAHLTPAGWLFLEHGYDQAAAVGDVLQAADFEEITAWGDLAGHPRVSGGRSHGGAR